MRSQVRKSDNLLNIDKVEYKCTNGRKTSAQERHPKTY